MALGRGHHICSNSAPKSVDNSKQNRNTRKMISVLSGRLRGASEWIGGANDAESFRSGAPRHSLTHFSHVQLHSNLMTLSLFPITALALSFSLSLSLSIRSFILLAQSHSLLSQMESEFHYGAFFSVSFTRLRDYDNFSFYNPIGFKFKTSSFYIQLFTSQNSKVKT